MSAQIRICLADLARSFDLLKPDDPEIRRRIAEMLGFEATSPEILTSPVHRPDQTPSPTMWEWELPPSEGASRFEAGEVIEEEVEEVVGEEEAVVDSTEQKL